MSFSPPSLHTFIIHRAPISSISSYVSPHKHFHRTSHQIYKTQHKQDRHTTNAYLQKTRGSCCDDHVRVRVIVTIGLAARIAGEAAQRDPVLPNKTNKTDRRVGTHLHYTHTCATVQCRQAGRQAGRHAPTTTIHQARKRTRREGAGPCYGSM